MKKITSLDQYFKDGGKVCGCVKELGGLGKCKQHTNVHTVVHMGYIRYSLVYIRKVIYWLFQK